MTIALGSGCDSASDPADSKIEPPKSPQHPVRVVVVEAEDLGEPIRRQWSAQTDGEVEVVDVSTEQLFANDYAAMENADVLIYPSRLLAHLVADEKISVLLDEVWDSSELDNKGLLSECRSNLIRFGRERWATPISHPHSLLMLRRDVLDAVDAETPGTWQELLELKQRIVAAGDKTTGLPVAFSLPIAGDEAALMMLSIAAAEVRHRGKLDAIFQRSSMKPLVAREPYVKALKTLKELVGETDSMNSSQTAARFFSGEAAIAIGWPVKVQFEDADRVVSDLVLQNTIVSRLPGSMQWYDFSASAWNSVIEGPARIEMVGNRSYQASVLKSASYPTSVNRFVSWLSSKSATNRIISNSEVSGPTRYSQLGDIQNWTGDIFSVENADRAIELLTEIDDENVTFSFPRIRGSHEYLDVLADGVRSVLRGEQDAEKSLQAVAEQWEVITERYGREDQIQLLRTDLGF